MEESSKKNDIQDEKKIENKTNYFVRGLIVIFCGLLTWMIIYNYFCIAPKGEISSGLITLLFILLVVVLSETFDQFAIGKLFSISREAKKKEANVKKLEKENKELLSQLVNITNSQKQTQQTVSVSGDYIAPPSSEITEVKTENDNMIMGFTPSISKK